MDESTLQSIAAQLRKPEGDTGKQMAERMNISNELINKWSIEQLHICPGDSILEIGMGNGIFVKDILAVDPSVTYIGFDYSETMIEEAIKNNEQFIENKQAEFIQGSVDTLPFSDSTFNKIFAVNVIYFWETPERELAELRRVLQPKGKLVFGLRPASTMQYYPFAKYGFTQYSKESLSDLLTNHGFVVTEIFERKESEFEVQGEKMQAESLIVTAEKV